MTDEELHINAKLLYVARGIVEAETDHRKRRKLERELAEREADFAMRWSESDAPARWPDGLTIEISDPEAARGRAQRSIPGLRVRIYYGRPAT